MAETVEELAATLDKADEHTAWMVEELEARDKKIVELELALRMAEAAANHNYEGWQQEIVRNETRI